jgi:high-affinity K+ transport system ATPase subunit B
VPFDFFILKGICTSNESTLTGESQPILKQGAFEE